MSDIFILRLEEKLEWYYLTLEEDSSVEPIITYKTKLRNEAIKRYDEISNNLLTNWDSVECLNSLKKADKATFFTIKQSVYTEKL